MAKASKGPGGKAKPGKPAMPPMFPGLPKGAAKTPKSLVKEKKNKGAGAAIRYRAE